MPSNSALLTDAYLALRARPAAEPARYRESGHLRRFGDRRRLAESSHYVGKSDDSLVSSALMFPEHFRTAIVTHDHPRQHKQ